MCVYIYVCVCEYYSDIKKDETIKIVAMWKDPEIIILRDVKQMEKDKYMISVICEIERKKIYTSKLFPSRKKKHKASKLMVTKGEGGIGEKIDKFGGWD